MGDKPVFRVGAAGLDPRDWRLIEIVFRHSQYNRYEFRLASRVDPDSIELLVVNPAAPEGQEAIARVRQAPNAIPEIAVVPRGVTSVARHAISIDRLTLQLLPVLNRVVELELMVAQAGRRSAATVIRPPSGDAAAPVAAAAQAVPAPDFGTIGLLKPSQELPVHAATPAPAADQASSPAPRPEPGRQSSAAAARARLMDVSARGPNEPIDDAATERAAPGSVAPGSAAPGGSAPAGMTEGSPAATSTAATSTAPGSPVARIAALGGPAAAEPVAPITPVAPAPSAAPPPDEATSPAAAPRARVLIVDDSPTVRRQLTVAFQRLGIECEQADSAELALRRLDQAQFDLVLADVVMPDMDGYRLTREIKRNRRLRGLPVIILTSRSSPFDLARGALAGCDSYLSKPVPFRTLEAAVRKHLGRRQGAGPTSAAGSVDSASAAAAPATRSILPLARVARLFGR